MVRTAFALAATILFTTTAQADFKRWSVMKEDDPFAKGNRVTVDYMETIRSGVFIFCETEEPGLRVRVIPGYAYSPAMAGQSIEMAFAIDGEILLEGIEGGTATVGDNLAAAESAMSKEEATKFLAAFSASKKQVAIKDGMSDAPQLLRASGSTKSAEALAACVAKQP